MRRRSITNTRPKRVGFFSRPAPIRPGTLRAAANRAGALTKRGTIRRTWLLQAAKWPGRTGAQARQALRLKDGRPP